MKLPVEFTPLHRDASRDEIMSRLEAQFRSTRGVLSSLDLPDLSPDGRSVEGNIVGQVVKAIFTESNVDLPIVHRLGGSTTNWEILGRKYYDKENNPVDPESFVDIRDGHKSPGENVTYLRCTFSAPVKKVIARIYLHGNKRTTR